MITKLRNDHYSFPDTSLADEDGLLAYGGDLSVPRLLMAYTHGIFPWYSDDSPIMWYSPPERFVLFPEELKISKSMRQVMKSGQFDIRYNTAFSEVIRHCAATPRAGQDGTWITADMQAAYLELHRLGFAHSVEAWYQEELVGGLYGVALGHVFCGESMFSKMSNASKATLISLVNTGKYEVIDCQVYTPHLESLGAVMITREEFESLLPKIALPWR